MELRAIKAYYSGLDGLVTLEDDVHSIIRQVRELYGQKIKVCWEPTTEHFVFSEVCEDKSARLIFVTKELDHRALDRLQRSDSQSRMYEDPYEAAEREQDELQNTMDQKSREGFYLAGERLAHALKQSGMEERLPLAVPMSGKTRSFKGGVVLPAGVRSVASR